MILRTWAQSWLTKADLKARLRQFKWLFYICLVTEARDGRAGSRVVAARPQLLTLAGRFGIMDGLISNIAKAVMETSKTVLSV
jgi:hypothetical protein